MRRNLSLSLVAYIALAGCGSVVPEDESPEAVGQAVASSYGGQTETDEAPAFGDADLAAATSAEDPEVTDMTAARPELRDARHVTIAVVWGYLRPHPEATEVVDWSGTISVTNAGLRVLRKLHFEESDAVLRPRDDIHVVGFESQTKPHADGLLLDVVIAPVLNPDRGPIVVSFNTAPFTGSITIEAGMRLTQATTVDDAGHMVAFHVIRPDADGCAEGFLRGRWHQVGELEGGKLGVLRGIFTAHDGRIRGHLRGVYGVRENGHQVWFAKVIDREGTLIGLLAGRYADGKLGGLFLTRNDAGDKVVKGMVRGEYVEGASEGEGAFFGRYSERCGEDPREGMVNPTDEPELALEESL